VIGRELLILFQARNCVTYECYDEIVRDVVGKSYQGFHACSHFFVRILTIPMAGAFTGTGARFMRPEPD